jgi:hypothetical protein
MVYFLMVLLLQFDDSLLVSDLLNIFGGEQLDVVNEWDDRVIRILRGHTLINCTHQ